MKLNLRSCGRHPTCTLSLPMSPFPPFSSSRQTAVSSLCASPVSTSPFSATIYILSNSVFFYLSSLFRYHIPSCTHSPFSCLSFLHPTPSFSLLQGPTVGVLPTPAPQRGRVSAALACVSLTTVRRVTAGHCLQQPCRSQRRPRRLRLAQEDAQCDERKGAIAALCRAAAGCGH